MKDTSIKQIVVPDAESGGRLVADHMRSLIESKPDSVLGLATGSTPVRVYREFVSRQRTSPLDLSRLRTFNLDEYVGLPADHPQSFQRFMQEQLFCDAGLTLRQTQVPLGIADDLQAAAVEYENSIKDAGGIDWQLLGIGRNGHIAFNEPGSAADSRTRVIDLTEDTIIANSRFFESPREVPRQAVTMGIATILEAKSIWLLAFGEPKAGAVQAALNGPVTPECPASLLQNHPNVTFVVDQGAATISR